MVSTGTKKTIRVLILIVAGLILLTYLGYMGFQAGQWLRSR